MSTLKETVGDVKTVALHTFSGISVGLFGGFLKRAAERSESLPDTPRYMARMAALAGNFYLIERIYLRYLWHHEYSIKESKEKG